MAFLQNASTLTNADSFAAARQDREGLLEIVQGRYRVRLANSDEERRAAYRLRFLVFNLELNEGLETAYETGQDIDQFDATCDHLIVEHLFTRNVVGTYRLQTDTAALSHAGFYCEREFDLRPYMQLDGGLVELGRACVHRDHRLTEVLYLLWRGIAKYAGLHRRRYLIGCSSLTSQDPAQGAAAYRGLREFLVEPSLRTQAREGFIAPGAVLSEGAIKIPRLLRAYLSIGARICGPPAIDREFKTIDFLTLLDMESLHPRVRKRFLKM